MPSWWSLGCSQVPQLGLAGRQSYCHLFDKAFIKSDAKSQRLLFHVIVIYLAIYSILLSLSVNLPEYLWRYAESNRHTYVSHMFCKCISNWYEVYWISKWTKAQEQQNSHKQSNVTYPADCLPNCSPVYLFDFPGTIFKYQEIGSHTAMSICLRQLQQLHTQITMSCSSSGKFVWIWALRNHGSQIRCEITRRKFSNGHLAVRLQIEAVSTSCSHRS